MGEEIDASIIQKTQDSLGTYVKKPPLTEKLLRKPPFRYLHDIISTVVNTTGFMKHLYTADELKAENIKDKDSKINFLQRAIDVVALTTGQTLSIRPSKVVAGHEADKTNEFLQALALAIPNKEKGREAVRRVKHGESLSKTTNKKTDSSKKASNDAKESQPKDRRGRITKSDSQEIKDKKERASKDAGRASQKDSGKVSQKDSRTRRTSQNNSIRPKNHEKKDTKDENHSNAMPEEELPSNPQASHENGDDHEDVTMLPMVNGDSTSAHVIEDNESTSPKKVNSGQGDAVATTSMSARPPSSRRTRSNRPRSNRPPTAAKVNYSIIGSSSNMAINDTENQPVSRPGTSIARARTARPASARPPPPVVRSKRTVIEEPESQEVVKAVENVIEENDNDAEEDNAFVTEEVSTNLLPDDMAIPSTSAQSEITLDGQHGSLVSQMLETKKDLETGGDIQGTTKRVEIDNSLLAEASRKKERGFVVREIDKMRSSIQQLTRQVNPLGKIIDYLQEDVDSMQKDMEKWHRDTQKNVRLLKGEQSSVENGLEPLKNQLEELDQSIVNELDKISNVKANILRNEEKIHKLLTMGRL